MSQSDAQNVWFGIAMFLMGLVAGAILTYFVTLSDGSIRKAVPTPPSPSAAAPAAAEPVEKKMVRIAKEAGLSESEFTACMERSAYKDKVAAQMAGGQGAGISGTPGTIVYNTKTKEGRIVSGAQGADGFKTVIDAMLAGGDALKGLTAPVATNIPAIDPAMDHVKGDPAAPIVLIEYSDFQCPFCKRVHPTLQNLVDSYEGKVSWVYRHFPLDFHPEALPLAYGSECAAELGGNDGFWNFTDGVFR